MFSINKRGLDSQAGRRGFDPRLPLLKSVTSSLPKFGVSQCIPFEFNSRETLRASPPPRAGLFDMKSVIVPNLTGSRQEVTSVAGLIKGDSHLLLRTEATETAFKALPLADFRIIHLACMEWRTRIFPTAPRWFWGVPPSPAKMAYCRSERSGISNYVQI